MKPFRLAGLAVLALGISIALLHARRDEGGGEPAYQVEGSPGEPVFVAPPGPASSAVDPPSSLPPAATADDEGAREPIPTAAGAVEAPVRGRLLCRTTGEPLPDYLIEIRGPTGPPIQLGRSEEGSITFRIRPRPKRVERVVTDEDGRFRSEGAFEPGKLELVLLDHPDARRTVPDEPQRVEHDHSFAPGDRPPEAAVEVLVGPTYRFELTLPAGIREEDLYATFPGDPSTGDRGLHRVVADDPASPLALLYGKAASRPESLEPRAPLRAGEPRWVRFRAPFFFVEEPGDVHLRSLDGHWAGSAPVTALRGVYPEILRLELTPRGSVEGRVLASGKPVPSAWIQLTGSQGVVHEQGADGEGGFSFSWLLPGEYELRVQTDRYLEWTTGLSIEAGTKRELDVDLTPSATLASISGELRSRTGRHRPKANVLMLTSNEDPSFFLIQTVFHRKRDGAYVASFSFVDVPVGSYEVRLDPMDNLRWNPRRMTVSAPAEGLEFLCEDDVATFDLGFRAVDSATGQPLKEFWTIVWQGDPAEDVRLQDDWETKLYEDLPEGVPIRWMLRAKGYRLAWGDEKSLTREGEVRIAEARLVPGWGEMFVVTTPEREPLTGVELLVDGEAAGRTDVLGRVELERDARPSSLEFRLDGWHGSWGGADPTSADFGWGPETPIYLERDGQ